MSAIMQVLAALGGAGGGAVAYALNPLDKSTTISLTNSDRTATKTSGGFGHVLVRANSGVSSGKWYWEIRQDATMANSREIAAITRNPVEVEPGSVSGGGYGYNGINGQIYTAGGGAAFGATYTTGDVIGCAYDGTAGTFKLYKNNVLQNTQSSIPAGTWYPTVGLYDQTGAATVALASADQTYSPPAGYTAVGGTLNPLDKSATLTLSNSDRTVTKSSGGGGHVLVRSTASMGLGKYYWEVVITATMTNSREVACITHAMPVEVEPGSLLLDGYGYQGINGQLVHNGSGAGFGSTFNTGDVIGVAFDAGTGKLWFAKNNTWQASGNPAAGTSPAATLAAGLWFPTIGFYDQTGAATANFKAADQTYSPPSGFTAIG